MKDKTEIMRELQGLMDQYDTMPANSAFREILLAKIEMLGWVLNKKIKTYPGGEIAR